MERGRKPTFTPKAIINKKFSGKALYRIEEIEEPVQKACPGLAIPQKGPCLYRCFLELPDFTVVSDTFKKKKDAEQCAAQMALEKLGIDSSIDNPTVEEAWEDVISRIKYIFSDEFLSAPHPVSGHFRAALRRGSDLNFSVPASIIAACDGKLISLCNVINPKVDSNPLLAIPYILSAAARLPDLVTIFEGQLLVQKRNPYPPEVLESSVTQESAQDSICAEAILIPCLLEKAVEPVTLTIPSTGYYLDVIAEKLGLPDGNKVLISRTIGKASSETRLYFSPPESYLLDLSSHLWSDKEVLNFEGPLNARASYFYGQDLHGNAILASIGYRWNNRDLFHEDLTLQSYYRMLINKKPQGIYQLSRNAILISELPLTFTTRTNWRGLFPKEILCTFCRQHHFSEPVFSTSTPFLEVSSELSKSNKKLKVPQSASPERVHPDGNGTVVNDQKSVGLQSNFSCEVRIYSKRQDLILECSPKVLYKKQNDAIQNASLKVLSWLNAYFKDPNMHLEKLQNSANAHDIRFYLQNFKEFVLCSSVHKVQDRETMRRKLAESNGIGMLNAMVESELCSTNIQGPDSGVFPSDGSIVCISYSVSLVTNGELMKELLESNEEFEFEMGTGAVIPQLETVLSQMSVGQSACFNTDLPPKELILAAAKDSGKVLSLSAFSLCCLEYSVTLMQVTEPPEDRMEQALFSPPLSKQRVEYAVQHIKESSAMSLVDFGCGSGSLLVSLLDYPTSLETIVGVDISQKSLSHAAKVLHSKLSKKPDPSLPSSRIKSAVLYDGSITDFDSRLCGFDIGTCLEVIEHMEEDQACVFGNAVLRSFRPKLLIVSTPNYEYNVLLQRSSTSDEDGPCKFRNSDHKFEWTREQFNHWASELAARHKYSVEFNGVGGSGDVEPGFASQIAVFRRDVLAKEDDHPKDADEGSACQYRVIWEWSISNLGV